jgi:3-deoxy-D-manno-octulosonic-acid transferase
MLLAETAQKLKVDHPDLELVIIPRHAERGGEIAKQLETAGFLPILQKTNEARAGSSSSKKKVWIANTTGELRAWYFLAEIVVVGKSLCGKGGQNPVEPILTGKPTIVGPNMENFADIVSNLVKADGIVQITGTESLFPTVDELLSNPTRCEVLIRNGAAALERHRGATKRTANLILGAPQTD